MKPHTYRFVFAALLLTMLAVFGIAFTADSEPQNSSLKTDGMKDAKLAEKKNDEQAGGENCEQR